MAFSAKTRGPLPPHETGGKAFDDESLDLLSHVLDDFIKIPGTSIRFGLDASLGLSPASAT